MARPLPERFRERGEPCALPARRGERRGGDTSARGGWSCSWCCRNSTSRSCCSVAMCGARARRRAGHSNDGRRETTFFAREEFGARERRISRGNQVGKGSIKSLPCPPTIESRASAASGVHAGSRLETIDAVPARSRTWRPSLASMRSGCGRGTNNTPASTVMSPASAPSVHQRSAPHEYAESRESTCIRLEGGAAVAAAHVAALAGQHATWL